MTTPAITAKLRADARMRELLPRLQHTRREKARLEAEEAELLAEARYIADDWADDEDSSQTSAAEFPHRSVAAEIAAAWRVSDRTVQRQMNEAVCLVSEYSGTLSALAAGEISIAHARIILDSGEVIERTELREEFEATILEYAKAESASRLAPIAKRRAEWFAERTVDERHRRARGHRRVWVSDLPDGMAEVHAVQPAVIAYGIHDRLTRFGRSAIAERDSEETRGADDADNRSIDELRADILADLLLATDPVAHNGATTGLGAVHAQVQVTVPVLALIDDGIRDPFETAVLAGHSPVDLATARLLAANAPGWDRVLTHPVSGAVLAVDRYRSTADLRRHLQVRDEHCRFPGCRMAVRRCDIDHTIDHALGGATSADNLAHLCRRHHTLKHQTAWTVVHRPGGVLEWTSPIGLPYADTPVSTVAFAPDPECELEPAPF